MIEFFVGCFYETHDRRRVICLKNDAPGDKPNIVMDVEAGDVWKVGSYGERYNFQLETEYVHVGLGHFEWKIKGLAKTDDYTIIRMLPDEQIEEILSDHIYINRRIKWLREQDKAVKEIVSEMSSEPTKSPEKTGIDYTPKRHILDVLSFWR